MCKRIPPLPMSLLNQARYAHCKLATWNECHAVAFASYWMSALLLHCSSISITHSCVLWQYYCLVKWTESVLMMAVTLYVRTHPSTSNAAFQPSPACSLQISGIKWTSRRRLRLRFNECIIAPPFHPLRDCSRREAWWSAPSQVLNHKATAAAGAAVN